MARRSPKTPEPLKPSESSEPENAGARTPIQDAPFKKPERGRRVTGVPFAEA